MAADTDNFLECMALAYFLGWVPDKLRPYFVLVEQEIANSSIKIKLFSSYNR